MCYSKIFILTPTILKADTELLFNLHFCSEQEEQGSRQEGLAPEGAEEEEKDEEDHQEDQKQRHLFNAWTHLLHTRQPALAHASFLDTYGLTRSHVHISSKDSGQFQLVATLLQSWTFLTRMCF